MISGIRGEGFGGEELVVLELMRTFFNEEPFQHNRPVVRDSSSIHAQASLKRHVMSMIIEMCRRVSITHQLSMTIFKIEWKLVGASP